MSRGRLIPSLNYRSKGLIDMSIHNGVLRGMDMVNVYGASNIDDALSSPKLLFSVPYDQTFRSPFITQAKLGGVEESHRDLTRFVFNLSEYSTTFKAGASRIPNDDEMLYLRLSGRIRSTQEETEKGPIIGVCPYDFFGVTAPVFTCVGTAPNINDTLPDSLGVGSVNLHLPYFSQTVNIQNLGVTNLLFTCAPGMSPTILKAGESYTLTSAAVPEFFFAGQTADVQFTLRCSVVNRG